MSDTIGRGHLRTSLAFIWDPTHDEWRQCGSGNHAFPNWMLWMGSIFLEDGGRFRHDTTSQSRRYQASATFRVYAIDSSRSITANPHSKRRWGNFDNVSTGSKDWRNFLVFNITEHNNVASHIVGTGWRQRRGTRGAIGYPIVAANSSREDPRPERDDDPWKTPHRYFATRIEFRS